MFKVRNVLVRQDETWLPGIKLVFKTGGGATGTIRPSTSPRMPTGGFEVRGRLIRQSSPRFASVHFEVDGRGREFAVVRRRSPKFAGVAVTVGVRKA
jgi:hypothetical protein